MSVQTASEPAGLTHDELRAAENRAIEERRAAAGLETGGEAVGLAISGGGIRSAVHGLGAVQAFARAGLWKHFDYMSTVSGGGYLGSLISSSYSDPAWLAKLWSEDHPSEPPSPDRWLPVMGRTPMHHIRARGNVMMPDKAPFGRDSIRALGAVMIGVGFNLTLFALALVAISAVLVWIYGEAAGWSFVKSQGHLVGWSFWNDTALRHATFLRLLCPWGWGAATTVGALTVVSAFARSAPGDRSRLAAVDLDGLDARTLRRPLVALMLMLTIASVVCTMCASERVSTPMEAVEAQAAALLLTPVAFAIGAVMASGLAAVAVFGLSRELAPNRARKEGNESDGRWLPWERHWRVLLDSAHGSTFLLLGASIYFAALPFVIRAADEWMKTAWVATGLSLAAIRPLVSRVVGAASSKPRVPRWVIAIVVQVAVPAFLTLAVVAASISWVKFVAAGDDRGLYLLVFAVVAVALLAILLIAADFNRLSPHYFYRDRLADVFLRTEWRKEGKRTLARSHEDVKLTELPGGPHFPARTGDDASTKLARTGPIHLVECSLNVSAHRDLSRRDRRSDVWVFSPLYSGSSFTGYMPTGAYRQGKTKLSRAMAISGAAVSAGMGVYGSSALAFATTLLNLRLGYWMTHPGFEEARTGRNGVIRTVDTLRCLPSKGERKGDDPEVTRLWHRYLWRELTGRFAADTALVNLSDGGHTGDNVAIYPLLQRRCRLIVAIDGGCDGSYGFADLASALDMIQTDEDVQAEVRFAGLVPDSTTRLSKERFAIGRIEYPPRGKGKIGWLIYMKACVAVPEPINAYSYRRRNTDFPHETTADQFFSDEQFDAYRSIGEAGVRALMKDAEIAEEDFATAEALVTWCEKTWKTALKPPPLTPSPVEPR